MALAAVPAMASGTEPEPETPKVASYNGVEYATLGEAVTEANKSGGTITLLSAITLDANLTISKTLPSMAAASP